MVERRRVDGVVFGFDVVGAGSVGAGVAHRQLWCRWRQVQTASAQVVARGLKRAFKSLVTRLTTMYRS